MLNVKLNTLMILVKEVKRLEKLKPKMSKSSDSEKKKEFEEELRRCREEKEKLLSEKLLENTLLDKNMLEIAKKHYYKGMPWEKAYENSALYYKHYDEKKDKTYKNRYEKYIERTVQKFY